MIIYFEGTVFNAPVKTYVNTVNCSGVMGAGIALEFKLRYPEMFDTYYKECKNKELKIGFPRIYEYNKDTWIMNFPTKGHWSFPSKIQWIENGLKYFANNYKKINIESIAFPKLGTSNGGLEWEDVKVLMEQYLNDLDIDVYICLDEKQEAEGIEKLMLDKLNNMSKNNELSQINISEKQLKVINDNTPYSRIWHISKTTGIDKKSYAKIFQHLYKKVKSYNFEKSDDSRQLTLF